MTRRDYEKAARIVREYREINIKSHTRKETAWHWENAFVALFEQDNPRFDQTKFRAACQPKEK